MKHSQVRISRAKLDYNFNFFKSKLHSSTKLLVLVKANGYGLGDVEIATLAEELGANYIGVAYICEGIKLRKAGIKIPIIILTPGVDDFEKLIEYNLEPSIINKESVETMHLAAKKANVKKFPIHIKLDTGMQRVGFTPERLEGLKKSLESNNYLEIKSLFSHLAAADEPKHDSFTRGQIELFNKMSTEICSWLDYKPMKHILNSAGIERFTYAQMDMVRLGIGLYGTSCLKDTRLKPVASFVAPIIYIKEVKGGSIGYGRHGVVDSKVKRIATVPVGYADGVDRHLGRGNIKFIVNNTAVPTIGNICMDNFMIDVTNANVKIGDVVTIFGENPHPALLAQVLDTITYEIFTSVSARVEKVITE